MKVTVQPVRESVAATIVDILNPIITAGRYSVMQETSIEDQIEFIRSLGKRGIYHLAVDEDSGRGLGIQEVLPEPWGIPAFQHVGEIGTFVALDAHRLGIGHQLSEATFRAAREHGFLKLRAVIRADNPQAIAFYLQQGFRIIGVAERHAHIAGTFIDEVIAERML
jgi:L-amino acid N-acyltransferase YncA